MAWQSIGSVARRVVADVIEQRRKAARSAELDESLVAAAIHACPAVAPQALAAGVGTGRQVGA